MKKILKLLSFSLLVPFLASCGGTSDTTSNSSEGDVSSTISESSSVETPKEKLLKNIQGMKNYQVDSLIYIKASQESGSVMEMSMGNIYKVVEGGYSEEDDSSTVQSGKLSDYLEQAGLTLEQFLAMYEAWPQTQKDSLTFDVDADTYRYVMGSSGDDSISYHRYDQTEKQYIEYTYNPKNEVYIRCAYETRGGHVIEYSTGLVAKVVQDGTYTESSKTYKLTLTEEITKDPEFSYITMRMGNVYKSASLEVDNDYPKKLSFEIDLVEAAKTMGGYYGTLEEVKNELSFSKIGSTSVTLPTFPVECTYHIPHLSIEAEGHRYFCGNCNKALSELEAHTYSTGDFHICTKCGQQKGFTAASGYRYEMDDDYLIGTDETTGAKFYSLAYVNGEDGHAYSVSTFFCDTTDIDAYHRVKDYDDDISYCVDLKVVVKEVSGEASYVADGSCVDIRPITYKVYTNVEIDDSGEYPVVGSDELDVYLETATPAYTFTSYSVGHHEHSSTTEEKQVVVSECLTVKYHECDRCGEKCDYDLVRNHETAYAAVTYEELLAAFEGTGLKKNLEEREITAENYYFIKAYCNNCDIASYFAVLKSDVSSGYDHHSDLEAIHCSRQNQYLSYYNIGDARLPFSDHIYDATHCILCGEAKAA